MPVCPQCGTENPEVAKFCFACGSALTAAPPPQEVRKVVTIVFSDLKGSTSMGERLDSESLREVMSRYFDAMRAELERHGGVVEKFIGDAVMAVFGLPTLHEDDALRAVRAAAGMQRALEELNEELDSHWGVRLANRTGVNTGEVVAGDPTAGQRLVTGDAVNVAARLEQAAGEQEVLLGDLTYRLVRDHVEAEPVDPLELKGKADPVPAFRLVSVREAGERRRRLDAPMVGRDAELGALREAFAEAVADRRPRLVTVVGEAGVGKTRLVDELVRSLEERATVLRGRCLAYGDGITFWPLAEAVRSAAGIVERDSSVSAQQKLAALVCEPDVVARVASAIGLSQESFPVQELYWGARKLLELLASSRPLVVVFDDVHWAEATFLELVEHVVASADAPLLVVCPTRRELLERRPDWSRSAPGRLVELAPLTDDEAGTVARHVLGEAGLEENVRARVVEAAEGNPLFVEQLLSMLVDEGLIRFEDGRWQSAGAVDHVSVPPTIQALLAARLDRLGTDERAVIEPAAVIGHLFVRDAVEYLTTDGVRATVGAHLVALTDKQLVRPDLSRPAEEEAFRFHHILIRDTTYEGILKRARAAFHERFVEWADSVNREGAVEYEEILGYHLEQAHRYRSELGPLDEHGRALGAEAARRLAAAGHRAFGRGDIPAAANLLGRAVALLPESHADRLTHQVDYGDALQRLGRFDEAQSVLTDAIERAGGDETKAIAAKANLVQLLVALRAGHEPDWRERASRVIRESIAVFELEDDHEGLATAWRLLGFVHGTACRFGDTASAFERALEHSRLAGDRRQETLSATGYAAAALFGPTDVAQAVTRCTEMLDQVSGDRQSEATLLAIHGSLLALRGSFADAREQTRRSREILRELSLDVPLAYSCVESWRVEMLAGDIEAAERELRHAYDVLVSIGERFFLSTVSGLLGQTLYALERFDEVEELGRMSRELATEEDVDTQALWRCVQGKHLARSGAFADGENLVREALGVLEPTDAVLFKLGALLDLAEVRRLAGLDDAAALAAARTLAEAKQSTALLDHVDRLLSAAAAGASSA